MDIETLLPEKGVGYVSANRADNTHFGTAETIALIQRAAAKWFELHPESLLAIGHISRRGGGSFYPPHRQHRLGLEFDMRPLRKDGKPLPTSYQLNSYSQELMREFCRLLRAEANIHQIFFNDPDLTKEGLTRHATGHADHLHIWLKEGTKPAPEPVLRRGDRNARVIQLQDCFVVLGWLTANYVDGHFGPQTEALVKRVQASAVITQDGIYGPKSKLALEGLLSQIKKG